MLIVPESIENTDSSFYALKFYTDITIHWCINGMLHL